MATKSEQLQQLYHQHQQMHGGVPHTAYQVIKWAVENGRIDIPDIDPFAVMADDMARALREEVATDNQGRRYRRNHAIRVTKNGVQLALWAELETAPRDHMLKAFAQRRRSIVGDCVQLRLDVDAYNDMHQEIEPIQMVLDFTLDVDEQLAADGISQAA